MNEVIRRDAVKRLQEYNERHSDAFRLWQESGFKHDRKPVHEPLPSDLAGLACGATTRAGTPCKRTDIYGNGRCKFHGGLSTGAKTEEGKARQLEGYRRWQERKRLEAGGHGIEDRLAVSQGE
ncbi:HGGxSTG domain-containing protein [Aeromonas piscicola]